MTFHPMAPVFAALFAVVVAPDARAQAAAPRRAPEPAAPAVIKPADNLVPTACRSFRRRSPTPWAATPSFARRASRPGTRRKREMLISTRFADTNQVHEVRFPVGARRQLTFFPDRVGNSSWPRRSARLLRLHQGHGRRRVRPDLPARRRERRHHPLSPGGRSQNGLGPWSHQGDRMAFGSTRRNGADRDIYVMDPKDAASDADGARGEGRRLVSPRLVARRHEARGVRVRSRSTRATSGSSTSRRARRRSSRRKAAASRSPTAAPR